MLNYHILHVADLMSNWDIIVKAPIEKIWTMQKYMTHATHLWPISNVDPRIKHLDPRNPPKKFDTRDPRTDGPTQPVHSRNLRYNATHAI